MNRWIQRPLGFLLFLKLYSNQWKSYSQLRQLQLKKIVRLIRYVKKNVPFYQQIFEKEPTFLENFHSLTEIKKFPIITKSILNKNYENFISRRIDPHSCAKLNSSGSTGEPTTMLYDPIHQIFNFAFDYRYKHAIGVKFRYNQAIIEDSSYFPKINSITKHILYSRTFYLSVFQDPSLLVQQLQRLNPAIISGPPSIMEAIARIILENRIRKITPRKIICSNEVLDYKARELIEEAFHTKIFETYGLTEIPHVAWECNFHTGFHINVDNVLLEIVKNGKDCAPHEIGRIIITSFNNKVIPLIRYDTGDLGCLTDEKCPCGRNFPLIEKIYGRTNDLLHLPNGKITHPWILINALKTLSFVKQLQIIQEKEDLMVIKIVENHAANSFNETLIINTCKKTLGDEINFRIKKVSRIDRGKDRKFHVVISKLHQKYP